MKSPGKMASQKESGSSSGSATKNNNRLLTRQEANDLYETEEHEEQSPFEPSPAMQFLEMKNEEAENLQLKAE